MCTFLKPMHVGVLSPDGGSKVKHNISYAGIISTVFMFLTLVTYFCCPAHSSQVGAQPNEQPPDVLETEAI